MNTAIIHTKKRRAGFTLVEIMIVVAIIALLAAIAVPNFQRARKRTHATRILEDLRVLEYSLDRWAIENNKAAGDTATFADLKPFLKTSTLLYETGKDLYGREYGPVFTVDLFPQVSPLTAEELADVAPPEFWKPYQ
jgi:prepilin-type N-terminal cleavage/methylation domain-containing protein